MHIRRDYSESFFRDTLLQRRRRRNRNRLLFFLLAIAIAALIFVYTEQSAIQMKVLEIAGLQPTLTPLPSELATRASRAYLSGDLEEAAQLYERAVRESPDNIDYIYEFGQVLIDLDRPQVAFDLSEHIIDIEPTDPRGFTLKTQAMVFMGQDSAAIPIGRAGLEVAPNFAPLNAAISRAYTNSQNWREGLNYGERAIELDPSSVGARRAYAYALTAVGEPELAIDQLLQAIEIQPAYAPPYFELASLYLATDRDQEAIDIYDRILSVQPRNARALLRQCQAYRKVGEFERAMGFCEDAVAAQPEYVAAQFQLGALLYNRREFQRAQEAFQACVSYDPGNLECSYRLALTHYYLGDCDTSWRMLQDSLIMAQSRENTADTVENIRQGLTAISSDANCPQYSGIRQPTTPESE